MLRTVLTYTSYTLVGLFVYTFIAMQLYPLALKLMRLLNSGDVEGTALVYVIFWPISIALSIVATIVAGPIYLCYLTSPVKRKKNREKREREERAKLHQYNAPMEFRMDTSLLSERLQEIGQALKLTEE